MNTPVEIKDVLDPSDAIALAGIVGKMTWRGGRATAGPIAGEVKHNSQADDNESLTARKALASALKANVLFTALVRPRDLFLLFNRYELGDDYGLHVDAATAGDVRRDVSFTLFLSRPESYDGGELVIESSFAEERFKLEAGSMIVYPSTSLHRVTPVERGRRICAVGWARSLVRDASKRELLFELDAAKSALFSKHGKSSEVDLISKCSANLMRMWMED